MESQDNNIDVTQMYLWDEIMYLTKGARALSAKYRRSINEGKSDFDEIMNALNESRVKSHSILDKILDLIFTSELGNNGRSTSLGSEARVQVAPENNHRNERRFRSSDCPILVTPNVCLTGKPRYRSRSRSLTQMKTSDNVLRPFPRIKYPAKSSIRSQSRRFNRSPSYSHIPTQSRHSSRSPSNSHTPTQSRRFNRSPSYSHTPTQSRHTSRSPSNSYIPTQSRHMSRSPSNTHTSTQSRSTSRSPSNSHTPTQSRRFNRSPYNSYIPTQSRRFNRPPSYSHIPTQSRHMRRSPFNSHTPKQYENRNSLHNSSKNKHQFDTRTRQPQCNSLNSRECVTGHRHFPKSKSHTQSKSLKKKQIKAQSQQEHGYPPQNATQYSHNNEENTKDLSYTTQSTELTSSFGSSPQLELETPISSPPPTENSYQTEIPAFYPLDATIYPQPTLVRPSLMRPPFMQPFYIPPPQHMPYPPPYSRMYYPYLPQ